MTRFRLVLAALLALALVWIPAVAQAKFTRGTTAALKVSTDTLTPPSGVRYSCYGSAGRIIVSWAITSDAYATGYTITGTYGGSSQSVSVTPRSATTTTPTYDVPQGTTIAMVSVYRNWTSARTPALSITTNCP